MWLIPDANFPDNFASALAFYKDLIPRPQKEALKLTGIWNSFLKAFRSDYIDLVTASSPLKSLTNQPFISIMLLWATFLPDILYITICNSSNWAAQIQIIWWYILVECIWLPNEWQFSFFFCMLSRWFTILWMKLIIPYKSPKVDWFHTLCDKKI